MPYVTESFIVKAMRGVVDNAIGYEEGSVIGTAQLTELRRVLDLAEKYNGWATDLKRLTKDALESQDAANPRPISLLLHYAIGAAMENGGNPAFVASPLVRLYLNTLLNIMGYERLPQYARDYVLYSHDIEALEASLKDESDVPIPN